LYILLSIWAIFLIIRFCSNIKSSTNTGITDIYNTLSCEQDFIFVSLTFRTIRLLELVEDFDIYLKTLFELNKNKLFTAKLALIFFDINTIFLVELKKKVKYYLLIVFISFYLSQLVWL